MEEASRRYSAPCMLQESPSLPIVLMCLVERRSPRMDERFGGWNPKDPSTLGEDWRKGWAEG